MAIFTGNWLDDDGVPFDPSAKVNEHYATSGSACLNRTGQVPRRHHQRFASTIRYAAHRWHNDLDAAHRALWADKAAAGPSRRGTLDRTPTNGWTMFNAFDFLQLWHDPPSAVTGPYPGGPDILSSVIDSVDLEAGTVTFTATAEPGLADVPIARLATFQVDPAAALAVNPWRATRLIDLALPAALDPGPYTNTVPLAWPITAGQAVRIYWRGRVANWWTYHAEDTWTP